MGPLITSQQTKERRDWAWTRKSYKAFPPLPITSSSWSPTPKRAPPIGNSVSKHWSGGGERGGTFHTQTLTMPTVIALPFSNWMAIFPMFLCQGRTRRNNWVSMCEATAALPGTVLQLYESPDSVNLHKSLLQSLHGKLKREFIWFFLLSVWFCPDRSHSTAQVSLRLTAILQPPPLKGWVYRCVPWHLAYYTSLSPK